MDPVTRVDRREAGDAPAEGLFQETGPIPTDPTRAHRVSQDAQYTLDE